MNDEKVTEEKEMVAAIEIEKDDFVDKEGIDDAIVNSAFNKNVAIPAKIFMDDDEKVVIDIDILSNKETGKIVSVFRKDTFPIGEMKELFGHCVESFEFSIPSYEDVCLYRQRASNNASRKIDKILFWNLLMTMHLKDWSLKMNEKKIELDFDVDGILTKESMKYVNKVPTVIWDVVMTSFERETLIS